MALLGMAQNPPQSLLIEGGDEEARLELALFWAMIFNCQNKRASGNGLSEPCLDCQTCRQIMSGDYLDVLRYDGRISNKQDEEKPGPVRALRMENMRELKSVLGSASARAKKRVVIFSGMGALREEALNSLLKTLEEPDRNTLFVLLAPQRYQILPTLVSRSVCLTLPWHGLNNPDSDIRALEDGLASFLRSGSGFLNAIAAKGAVDADLAGRLIVACQQALINVCAGVTKSDMERSLRTAGKDAIKIFTISHWLAEAQAMLEASVNPVRVLEALSSRLAMLVQRGN